MNNIKDRASLSEPTVQKVARGEHEPPKRKRPRAKPWGPKSSAVSRVKVHDMVMDDVKARKVNPRHVQIVDAQTVVVWNHPAPWPGQTKEGL